MNEAETSQQYVAMFAEHQKKQQRLSVAVPILAALVQSNTMLWISEPEFHMTHTQMVGEALDCADLLLEKIYG
ncbi:hypothetical protein [Microcoleus sp. MON2_D5]|uniref:hypothetical protein n=1 Tax=Microcoleus sp. MON2_D5 TaxID=2818833 RepID=UPI002FD208C5